MFAKRQQKSVEWVVKDVVQHKADEKVWREAVEAPPTPSYTPTHKLPPTPSPLPLACRDFNARARPFARSYL